MTLILIHPGERGDLVDLNEALRERYEEARAQRDRDIAERKAKGTPLDDVIDWSKVSSAKVLSALSARDSAALRAAATELTEATAGLLVPLHPYQRQPRLDGVKVRCIVLTEKRRRILGRQETIAEMKRNEAIIAKDVEAAGAAVDRIYEARRAFVAEAVAHIEVADDLVLDKMDENALDLLERNGLLLPIFDYAASFQDLSPGKDSLSGSSAASTSRASTAPAAQSIGAPAAAAMAEAR